MSLLDGFRGARSIGVRCHGHAPGIYGRPDRALILKWPLLVSVKSNNNECSHLDQSV